jgi:replicative DNA helicase
MGITMLKFNLYHPVINLILSHDGVIDELDLETNVVSDTATRVLIDTCFQLHEDKQSIDLNTIKARVYAEYGQEGVDAITTVAMESLAQPANINALSDYVSQINDTNNKRTLQVDLQKLLTQCSSNKTTDEIIGSMHSVVESYQRSAALLRN